MQENATGCYNVDLPLIDRGIEGGYVDMGGPSANLAGGHVGLEYAGWDLLVRAAATERCSTTMPGRCGPGAPLARAWQFLKV